MNNCRYCGHELQSHRNGQCHAIARQSQIGIMNCHCEEYRGSKGNGETCAVCGAIAQCGLLCKKHYSYNDFTGLRLWREVEKEKKWKKRIMYD